MQATQYVYTYRVCNVPDVWPGAACTAAFAVIVRVGDVTAIANRLTEVARSEGWGRGQLSYAAASIAAASGSPEQAVVHLREAVDAGWNDFAMADHDPVLADVIQLLAYRALTP